MVVLRWYFLLNSIDLFLLICIWEYVKHAKTAVALLSVRLDRGIVPVSACVIDSGLSRLAGEVLSDGSESVRDGEHGVPHRGHDGQARLPRLLRGGGHGQGN